MQISTINSVIVAVLLLLTGCQISANLSPSNRSTAQSTPSPPLSNVPPVPQPKVRAPSTTPHPQRSFSQLQDQVPPGSSFDQFRKKMQQAIRDRNVDFMRAIVDPKILVTFGRHGQFTDFSELGFEDANSLFWKQLERSLSIGCKSYDSLAGVEITSYHCPYISEIAEDPFKTVYIIGEKICVRSQPQINSPVIKVLTNELVKLDSTGFEHMTRQQKLEIETFAGWYPIITPEGKQGYVSSRYAYMAVGHRTGFENKKGQWKMMFFISGGD